MNNNILIYNRNFSGTVSMNLDIEIERYSHSMIGGPDRATLRVVPLAEKWELTKLLRCPVEIYGEDGGIKWWGYINRVVIPHGKLRIGLGLDEFYNSITVKYDGSTTSAAVETQSTSEYGTKEFFINLSNATQVEAEAYRNTYLETHKYPMPETELSGGKSEIIIECYGWWKTLAWKYYTDAGATPIENMTQIVNIATACGQFLNGVITEPYTIPMQWDDGTAILWDNNDPIIWDVGSEAGGLTSVPTRDGSNNGLAYITELLNAGSSNARPMLCYVDRNRYLHVYERVPETTEYIMRDDGKLETLLGKFVEPENCLHAVWVRAKGVPDTLGGISAMRPFFIAQAEYVEEEDI